MIRRLEPSLRQAVLNSRILVASASASARSATIDALTAAGYASAVSVEDGYDVVRHCGRGGIDLVLLDLALPGLDGLAVCRALRADCDEAPDILIRSVGDDDQALSKAFDAGADDVLRWPIDPNELIARVHLHIVNRAALSSHRRFHDRVSQELSAAQAMQETLQPSPGRLLQIRATMGLDIAAHCEMSSELGGDLWGLKIIDDQRLAIFSADFSGHGVASAVNAFRLHAMLDERALSFEQPDLMMQAINIRLAQSLPRGLFATMFYGVIDLARGRLDYAAAGAPPPLLRRFGYKTVSIDTCGVPLGIKRWVRYREHSLDFPPGAALLLYSDAVIESQDAAGECWDVATLSAQFDGIRPEADAGDALASLLLAFNPARPRPLPDDLTVVCLRRLSD